ncbi:MAG: FtsQ-type POTRA domain-containing protein [Desulfobulbus sp.]|nr:FtsQ-type POTRA domain-containing protein [Desulfobulbus sp.]
MAIYTPRQASSRPRKRGRKPKWTDKLRRIFPRRPVKLPPPPRPQAVVTGAQRSWRWKQLFGNLFLTGLLFLITATLLWMGGRWLLSSDVFRLSDIRITGEQMVSERQILDLAGLQQGGNLLHFDAVRAKEWIESLAWVEHVDIHTQWPSTVEIVVSENQPFALVNVEEGKEHHLYYLSQSGHLFVEVEQGQELDYPVITGVMAGKDVNAGQFVEGSLAASAGQLLKVAARGNTVLPIQAISEVHVDEGKGVILYLVDRPFPVYFGTDRLQTKYYRLVRVLEQLYLKKLVDAVKEIRMDYIDDKVLVTGAQIDG